MRNITKILILVVVAFAVYLLWPRKADLKTFKPDALASLQIEDWKAEKDGKGATMTRFKIYTSQYHFAPVAAFRLGQIQSGILARIAEAKKPGADPAAESRALAGLREKYSMIKESVGASFDADVLANEEFGWRMSEQDLAANPDASVDAECNILAALYGGDPADFVDAASNIATARAIILTGGDGAEAATLARDGYSLLHEIAQTPPNSAPPAP